MNESLQTGPSAGEQEESVRINKYLSEAGFCSRREADRLIAAGKVTVNGIPASPGQRIRPDIDVIRAAGKAVAGEARPLLYLFHKPRGIVCSTRKQRSETTVTEYLSLPDRVYPVGRLDRESEGLLLMTNQGELANEILKARNHHEKEYIVDIDRTVTKSFLDRMASGVRILDTVTRPCKVEKTGERQFRIILTQGLNRQIRRMCRALGCQVTRLVRVRIMNLHLGSLGCGEYREIKEEELQELRRLLRLSGRESPAGRDSRTGGNA